MSDSVHHRMDPGPVPVRRGRPRSARAHLAIVEATRDLVLASGYEHLSIEAVAARAGVGKQTVYRWWPSKAALVADVLLSGSLSVSSEPLPDSGDLRRDLDTWVVRQAALFADPFAASLVRAVTTAAAEDDVVAARLYESFTGPARHSLLTRLRTGVLAGHVQADADLEAAADALLGAFLYTALARRDPMPLPRAHGLAALVLAGIQAP